MVPNPVTLPILRIFGLSTDDTIDHINLLEMRAYGQCLSSRDRKEETQFRNIYVLSHD